MPDDQRPALSRTALGVGLRPPHYEYVCAAEPAVGYFEAIADNFMSDAARPRQWLSRVRKRYPIVLHGVGLNLLGHAPLDEDYIERLCRLADWLDPPFVSDHLCWTAAHGIHHHDLLPVPYTQGLLELAAERAAYVQQRLGRPFGLENLSTYVQLKSSTMPEWEFYAGVVRLSGCHFMLDINNLYVSSHNHGFDPLKYLAAVDFSRVLQVHLAGHQMLPEGTIIDTHDRHVTAKVWDLYAAAWKSHGPFPTLLEWDDAIPPFPVLLQELARAEERRT